MNVGGRCRILKGLFNVFAFQVRVLGKDLIERPSRGDQSHYGLNTDTQTPDCGLALERCPGSTLIRSKSMMSPLL